MSRVPASARGWLASTPTGRPADRPESGHELRRPGGSQLDELAVVDDGLRSHRARRTKRSVPSGRRSASSGVGRSGGSSVSMNGGARRCGQEGRKGRRREEPSRDRRRWRRRRTARSRSRGRRCRRAPERSTPIPVNSRTMSGPETNANASGVIATTSASPSMSAVPGYRRPRHGGEDRHDPRAPAPGRRRRPPNRAWRRSRPVTSAPDEATTRTSGSRLSRAVRAASAIVIRPRG